MVHYIIGARMGGDCIESDLLLSSTSIDYVRTVILVACGIEPDLKPTGIKEIVSSRFIITKKDFDEFNVLMDKNPSKIIRLAFLN